MASNSIDLAWRTTRRGALLAAVLGALFLAVSLSVAQDPPISPAQAREAMSVGIEKFKKQEYEEAAGFLGAALQALPKLSREEQKDLTTFNEQNAAALKGRREGNAILQKAGEAVRQNRGAGAAPLLRSLESNQYLSPADRQLLSELNRQVQTQAAGAAPAGKADVKALLTAGREALKKGELDLADSLATQAEKASSASAPWMQSWTDSPTKLRRDVQAARAKLASGPDALPKTEPESKGSSWLPSMPNWFGKSDKQPTDNKSDSDRRVDGQMARRMVSDGFMFLQTNELDKATLLANKAKELNVVYGPNEATPDQLLHEIQRRLGSVKSAAPTPTSTPLPTPTAMAVEIKAPEAKPFEIPANADPHVLLRQGRTFLQQRKYEDADRICSHLLTSGARWGLWEDTPEKLRKDIQHSRQAFERDESVKVLAEARKLFTQGNIEEAEKKAYKAQQMHGPYGVFDFGDRPSKLLEEIQRAKVARGPAGTGVKTGPVDTAKLPASAKDGPNDPGQPAPPLLPVSAGMQNGDKNRAGVMLREAKELDRQGLWIEAAESVGAAVAEARRYFRKRNRPTVSF